jgi:serine/threonine protein kinase
LATPQEPGPPPTGTPPTRAERPRRATGPRNAEVADLLVGTMLGKYRIGRRLGSGGMGVVYQATHVEIGKEVALKVLSADLAEGTRARARFLREAAAASKIDHPNVVRVTDYGADGPVPYIVMELLRGEDLSGLLRRHRRGLPLAEAANILLAVCAAVFTAHQARVIHRDLKPRNIFLARTRMFEVGPKILDFGISKLEGEGEDGQPSQSLTEPGYLLGTPHYLSPEQVAGRSADARSDQYALGVVLFECLTGQRPHDGYETAQVLARIRQGAVPPPRQLRAGLPAALEVILLRALAVKPEARFATVHALGAAMLPFASPKQQVAWSDYYLGEQPPPSIAEELSIPDAGDAPPTSSTVFLRETADPIPPSTAPADPGATATLTLHRPEAPATEPDVEVPQRSRRPLRILLLLAVGGATFAGATYLMQHWPAQWRPGKLLPAIAPERLPVREEVVRPPTEPTTVEVAAEPTPASVQPTVAPPTAQPPPAAEAPPPAPRRSVQRAPTPRRFDRRDATTSPPPALLRNAVPAPVPTPLRVPPLPPDPAPPRSDDSSPSPAPILH